jgi:antitoxin HicB
MKNLKYPALIRPLTAEEGGGYLIEFPDLPGCIADGKTIEEALQEGRDAVKSWIKTAKEFGDPIPEPGISSKYSGQWRLRIPKSLHASLAMRAKYEGVSLNTLAATLLAEGLEHHWHHPIS